MLKAPEGADIPDLIVVEINHPQIRQFRQGRHIGNLVSLQRELVERGQSFHDIHKLPQFCIVYMAVPERRFFELREFRQLAELCDLIAAEVKLRHLLFFKQIQKAPDISVRNPRIIHRHPGEGFHLSESREIAHSVITEIDRLDFIEACKRGDIRDQLCIHRKPVQILQVREGREVLDTVLSQV